MIPPNWRKMIQKPRKTNLEEVYSSFFIFVFNFFMSIKIVFSCFLRSEGREKLKTKCFKKMSIEATSLFFELFGPPYVSLEVWFVSFGCFSRTLRVRPKSLLGLQKQLFFHFFDKSVFWKFDLLEKRKEIER